MHRLKKLPPVLLAAILQLMPICRAVYTFGALPGCGFAALAPWIVGALATMAGFDAVSGASNVVNSPPTASGTVGSNFTYRITTSQTFTEVYSASPVPPGITGLTNSTSSFVTGVPTTPGVTKMTVSASEAGYGTISEVVTVTISPSGPPVITSQPPNLTNTAGTTATFTAGVSDVSGYQWYFNSAALAGATNASLAITNVQSANAGAYFLMATNSLGSTNSATATLTVGYPPAISNQPPSVVSNPGSNVTFTVVVTPGSSNVFYHWAFNSNAIPGATNASYQVNNVQWTNAGNYSVVITNAFGFVTSSNATLTVAGDFVFGNHGTTNLTCPIYGPEPSNAYAVKTGNTSSGVPAGTQVYNGAKLSGTNYTAQLWGAVGASLPESSLAPIPGCTTNFLVAGFMDFVTPNPVVPGAMEGSVATFELRVWNNEGGTVTNWTQVLASTNADRGVSPVFNSPPLGGASPAPVLAGLVSFNTYLPSASGPPPVITFSGQVNNGQISLMFNATVGKVYTVQYETSLNNSWQTLTNFTAGVTNPVVTDAATNTTRFYRVFTTFP